MHITNSLLDYAPRKPITCNMDVLLAAVEALRRAEVNEYHSRAGKVSYYLNHRMPSRGALTEISPDSKSAR